MPKYARNPEYLMFNKSLKTGALISALLVLFFILAGCSDRDQDIPPSRTTGGELIIGIDESLKPFADAEIAMFTVYYPDSRITPVYSPEKAVIEKLLSNDIQTGIICRNLYKSESDYIENEYNHPVTAFKIADDRIVALANRESDLNTVSYDCIKEISSGILHKNETRTIVVTTKSSSIDRYFYPASESSPESAFALDSTTDVIDYVRNNASAIGLVGGSWLFKKKMPSDIKILTYSESSTTYDNKEKNFSREVYAVTHEPFTGLGKGFISFMASHKGQLIITRAGMTPFKPIEREIEISESF